MSKDKINPGEYLGDFSIWKDQFHVNLERNGTVIPPQEEVKQLTKFIEHIESQTSRTIKELEKLLDVDKEDLEKNVYYIQIKMLREALTRLQDRFSREINEEDRQLIVNCMMGIVNLNCGSIDMHIQELVKNWRYHPTE